jgi:(2R)-ethylmalonyl-CoA mutase
MQQVLAYETDLLCYDDLFDGSPVIEAKVASIADGARAEIEKIQGMGGAIAAVDSGYLKSELVASLAARRARMESGEDVVVGVNSFEATEPSPLQSEGVEAIETVEEAVEAEAIEAVRAWRASREQSRVEEALRTLRDAAKTEENLFEPTLACARAGVTTGEWAGMLREVFGEYRAPTGVAAASAPGREAADELARVRERVSATEQEIGARLRMVLGKPGLDGHSNGAEQIAVRARDAGFEVIYEGIRLTPAQIVAAAAEEGVHVIGLSVLSGSHMHLVPAVLDGLAEVGADDIPVVLGGIIPADDAAELRSAGVTRIFTPKDYQVTDMLDEIVSVIREAHGLA